MILKHYNRSMIKIGVFDSGKGGEAVAIFLKKRFLDSEMLVVNDRKNVPYGDKTPLQIFRLTDNAIQPLLQRGCDVIILACNTATTNALDLLRKKYPNQKFIGLEPMIKPASLLTKSKIIAVCATPATLKSKNYKKLLNKYAKHIKIIEPDCSSWAAMVENNNINDREIIKTIQDACRQNADVIVLGCTHYHWIKDIVEKAAGHKVKVIEPFDAVASRVERLLELS